MNKWVELLSRTEVRFEKEGSFNTATFAELEEYERRIGTTFPLGYKEYCSVFGEGMFGDSWITVYCPDLSHLEPQMRSNRDILDSWSTDEEFAEISSKIDSGYLFGIAQQALFFFDMETYREEDESCDIYGININVNICNFGRNFYEFIAEYCLGNKALEDFPDLVEDITPHEKALGEILQPTFKARQPYSVYYSDENQMVFPVELFKTK